MQRRALLEIRNDSMDLVLVNSKFLDEGIASRADLAMEMSRLNITASLDTNLVTHLLEQLAEGETIEDSVIASGQIPIPGENGNVEFDINVSGVAEVVDASVEEGAIDYKEQTKFTVVEKGDLLGRIIPPTTGQSGHNIYGTPLPAKDGFAYNIILQEGVERRGDELYATTAGIPHFRHRILKVHNCMTISHDVGPETGNIDAPGCVHISGDVLEGYTVNSAEDIFISGSIYSAKVDAKGSIVVKKGIQGDGSKKVKCKGSLTCGYMENALVEADGEVEVIRDVLHSQVSTLDKVLVKGDIIGGDIRALASIQGGVIGSGVGTKTKVSVLQHYDLDRFEVLREKLLNMGQEIYRRNTEIIATKKMTPTERINLIQDITDLETQYIPQLAKVEQMIMAFNQIIERVANPTIKYDKQCMHDVIVQFAKSKMIIRETLPAKGSFVRNKEFLTIEVKRG